MLLPDKWIRGNGVQRIEILGAQRPQLDEIATQGWLQFERHANILTPVDHPG
jgi:hypothetical protein